MAFISTSTPTSRGSKISFARLAQAFAVMRQRRQLADLDDAALRDMGLTHSDVETEIKRSAWDVPAHWRG